MPAFTFPSIEDASCDCRPCGRRRGLRAAIGDGYIESHSSQPSGGWRQPSDDLPGRPTFGVELETSLAELPYGVRRSTARRFADFRPLDRREAASLALPVEHWHPKSDCSVTGPEFASQPATLDWWRQHRDAIGQFLKELRHGGCGTEGAGLHVNIGTRTGFAGPEHLARFATLVLSNPRFATRMAGRTHDTASRWGKFTAIANPTDWGREVWAGEAWHSQPDRYSAVNGQAMGRVEFRLPAGTLDEVQFYAMLEWTASMVEFTRPDGVRPNVPAYIAWLVASGNYPAAESRLRSLFPARFTGLPAQRDMYVPASYVAPEPAQGATRDARCTARDGGARCTLTEGHSIAHWNGRTGWYDDADHADFDARLAEPPLPPEAWDEADSRADYAPEGSPARQAASTLECGYSVAMHRQSGGWNCPSGNTEQFDQYGCLARHDGTPSAWPCTCRQPATEGSDDGIDGDEVLGREEAAYLEYDPDRVSCLAQEPSPADQPYGWICTRPVGHTGRHAAIDVPGRSGRFDRW